MSGSPSKNSDVITKEEDEGGKEGEEKEMEKGVLENKSRELTSAISLLSDEFILNTSTMKCFKQIDISSSSIFEHPLYYFPELYDPGILQAFTYEPLPEIDNDVGRERYLRICKLLNVVPLKRVLNSLDQEELDLRFYGLRPNELRALFYVLEMNAYIKVLLLEDSWMTEDSVHLLSNMLCSNVSIEKLGLKQCEIGEKGAQELNECLQSSFTIKELDLSYNSLGDKGIRALRDTLKKNESLKKINLSHNNITAASAIILQQLFVNHQAIEDVDLGWNILCDDDGFKKIGAGLRSNTHIKVLNLAWNNLESIVVAKELARFIRDSTTLEIIDLSNNGFKEAPAKILRSAISLSESLKCFKIGNNPLNVNEVAFFGSVLLQNENLQTLDLENLYFPKSFNANLRKIKKLGKELIYGGVLSNYRIKGPNKHEVLLKRCHYLGLAPRKAKAKRDFGQIVLTFPEEIMERSEFENFIRKKKKGKMYDKDLLAELAKTFPCGKSKVDTKFMLSEYMKLYPDTALPPPKPKKEKKKKGKRRKKPHETTTATTTETDVTASFNPTDQFEGETTPSKTDVDQQSHPVETLGVSDTAEETHEEVLPEGDLKKEENETSEVESTVPISENVEVVEIID